MPGVDGHKDTERGVRHDVRHTSIDHAALAENEAAARLKEGVEAVKDRRCTEIRMIEEDPVALLGRANEGSVDPRKLAARRGRSLELLDHGVEGGSFVRCGERSEVLCGLSKVVRQATSACIQGLEGSAVAQVRACLDRTPALIQGLCRMALCVRRVILLKRAKHIHRVARRAETNFVEMHARQRSHGAHDRRFACAGVACDDSQESQTHTDRHTL